LTALHWYQIKGCCFWYKRWDKLVYVIFWFAYFYLARRKKLSYCHEPLVGVCVDVGASFGLPFCSENCKMLLKFKTWLCIVFWRQVLKSYAPFYWSLSSNFSSTVNLKVNHFKLKMFYSNAFLKSSYILIFSVCVMLPLSLIFVFSHKVLKAFILNFGYLRIIKF
jgi:hypothetical protein